MFQTFDKQKTHITKNGKYLISTNLTWDQGWETMVFKRDPITNDVDYTDLDVDRYNDQAEAYAGHEVMIQKWEGKQ